MCTSAADSKNDLNTFISFKYDGHVMLSVQQLIKLYLKVYIVNV